MAKVTITVTGPAGAGKTRFLQWLDRKLDSEGILSEFPKQELGRLVEHSLEVEIPDWIK